MEHACFGSKVIMRIDKGQEIVEEIKNFCSKHNIRLAAISGIGAVNKARVGVFLQESKEFCPKEYSGSMEIVSLLGTVTELDGQVYPHLHIALADHTCNVFGGHLNAAWVGATCELVLQVIDGKVERKFSEEIGLNLFRFANEEPERM